MKLSVISPTFNEAANVEELVGRVSNELRGVSHEIIIVDDDSPDQTWRMAQDLARRYPCLRVLRRLGKRGLATSVIDGFDVATGDAIACIDADLQHDPIILRKMLAELSAGADLVVGCRYMPGGGTARWNWIRRTQSRMATRMAQAFLGLNLRDPMSGYFLMWRKDFLRIRPQLCGQGFKILIEIAARLQPQTIVEVPYVFGPRLVGKSKLTAAVALDFLIQLYRLRAAASRAQASAAHFAG